MCSDTVIFSYPATKRIQEKLTNMKAKIVAEKKEEQLYNEIKIRVFPFMKLISPILGP